MRQPTKDILREQLALAEDEITRLRHALFEGQDSIDAANLVLERAREFISAYEAGPQPWWKRLVAWWRK